MVLDVPILSGMTPPRTHWFPVLGVLVAAPWFAEMSWGGYPFTDIPVILLFLAPLYGCAALLIREVVRRTGRGWPSILLLATAFGVFQAGIVDQSLFNPKYDRFNFQHPVHIDGIDISLYYLLAFVAGHVVASIATPIALAEAWSRRPSQTWLSGRGLWIVAGLYVLASIVNYVGVKDEAGHGFQASPLQTLAAMATVLALVAAALRWRRRPVTDMRIPRPWLLTMGSFLAYLLYLPGENTASFAMGVTVVAIAIACIGSWSRSRLWSEAHTAALVIGVTMVGVVMPFWTEPYDNTVDTTQELTADVAAALICLLIVASTIYRRRAASSPATSGP